MRASACQFPRLLCNFRPHWFSYVLISVRTYICIFVRAMSYRLSARPLLIARSPPPLSCLLPPARSFASRRFDPRPFAGSSRLAAPPDSNEETASYTLRNQLSIAIYTALARLHPLPIRSSQPFRPAPAHLPLLRFAPRTHPNFSYEFPKLPLPCDLVPLFLVPLFPRSSFACPLPSRSPVPFVT
jgi:hypothetical protein